ncbi:5'-methylthioadenosine/S-adenosylhomocysteine nucleosidase [Runella zeae]|uniref:5'-methylthioadenosine/S-adenosylhomocysteine nucleosidase family protein n=1 Tax=Runella zeae TaxID=94255 RepID=UPI002355F54D|nr:5'-methylthioadenosine/S-adenosylhomocysteine nucleosidase [Runella zeae]
MRILLQTALHLELNAMKAYLSDVKSETHPETGSKYERGIFSYQGRQAEVLLVETGAGNVRAAEETTRAIEHFNPDSAFFVGVAGGLKDVKLGDVVASTKVIGYEMGKDDDEFRPRLDTLQSAYSLQQIAKQLLRDDNWKKDLPEENRDQIAAYVEPIAAGDKVVASERAVAFQYLRKFCSDALAVAMEGNGFMVAAHAHNTEAMEIRGISDMISDKAEADASGSQPRAADNAAAFAFAIIRQKLTDTKKKNNIKDSVFRGKLLNTLLEMYPQGPEQDDIWKRAGGDVSILSNSMSRRSQWYNALERLALGGGGAKMTLQTLIEQVRIDYPNLQNDLF